MQTYLFYDIETTGLNKAFDQVLHFAAIRTDLELKELKRYELKIKLNPDIVPSPSALITHHMGVEDIRAGINELEAMEQIHQWLNQPGTISLGYNTLGFDDEFLRFSFYRNLLPPYTHQYANQCSRMDLYPFTVLYFLFKNHLLNWPTVNEKISLKLADLNSANQLAQGRAHDAMVDVEATLALAQRFFKERDMWDYVSGYFNKKTDQERMQLLQNSIGLMMDGRLREQNYQCPVLFLGQHRHYKNQLLWLRLDWEDLTQTTATNVPEMTRAINKKLGEPNIILPLKERFLQLPKERLALAEENKKWLEQHPVILQQISDYHVEYKYPVFPETDIDAALYLNGFWTPQEENFCRTFHAVNAKEKAAMIALIKNPRLQELAIRILGRHYPETLSAAQVKQFNHYMQKVCPQNEDDGLIDFKNQKRLTPQKALSEMIELREKINLTATQVNLLVELEKFLLNKSGVPTCESSV